MTEAETQDFQLKCLQCGAAVTARSDQAGEKVSCPSCSALVGVPAGRGVIDVNRPRPVPPPPPAPVLSVWEKLLQGVLDGLYSTMIHALFTGLFILAFWPNRSCFPSPAGGLMVALFPLHIVGVMISLAILGPKAAGLYTALLATVPISMLYTRAIRKLHVKMREKGFWWSLAAVLLILLVMFCSCVALPLV